MDDLQEVNVRFFTELEEYVISEKSDLLLPTHLGRWGLSEIVNQMLNFETPIAFDFLIDKEFLVGNLRDFLLERGKTAEPRHEIEYCLAVPKHETEEIDEYRDWVSSCLKEGNFLFSACYDGFLRIYSEDLKPVNEIMIDSSGIRKMIKLENQLVFGMDDGLIYYLPYSTNEKLVFGKKKVTCLPRDTACTSLAANEQLLACGCETGEIYVYDLEFTKDPLFTIFEPQMKQITGLEFSTKFENSLFVTSLDNSIRVFDCSNFGSLKNTWTQDRTTTSAHTALALRDTQLAVAVQDGSLCLYDLELTSQKLESASLKLRISWRAHRRLVTQINFVPNSDLIVSSGHDCCVKVYDPRSKQLARRKIDVLSRVETEMTEDRVDRRQDEEEDLEMSLNEREKKRRLIKSLEYPSESELAEYEKQHKPRTKRMEKGAKEESELDEIKVLTNSVFLEDKNLCILSGSSDGRLRIHKFRNFLR